MLCDYLHFLRQMISKHYRVVHLNPSLGFRALLRDGIFILIAKAMGKRVLVFIHGWDHDCESRIREKYLGQFRAVFFCADAIIVLAGEFKDKLREMGYTKPIHVEVTNVETAIFEDTSYARGYTGETFNVLYLSRIEREKGIYEALDAFMMLGHPSARLIVAGDGVELTGAKHYAETKRIKNVTFTGYITGSEKHQAFLEADVFLFPTYYGEGLPIAVLEAMAYGLPVITRPVGGLKDFFEHGVMGYMTESLDPCRYTEFLDAFLKDPASAARMGSFNRDYAREHFSADRVAARLQAIYAKLT